MKLHGNIFDRVKQKISALIESKPNEGKRTVDFLMKMNLSPLMGRRNAANDRVAEMMFEDLFKLSELERLKQYTIAGELLERAIVDTKTILNSLSSPDTERREKTVLGVLMLFKDIINTLEQLCRIEHRLFRRHSGLSDDVMSEFMGKGTESEQMINEGEIALVNQFRELWSGSRPRIERYRGYIEKSFSQNNSERYRKSYDEYYNHFGAFFLKEQLL